MSGTKCSSYGLAQERAARLSAIHSVNSLNAEVGSLRERLATTLAGASAGLRATFHEELERATAWETGLRLPDVHAINPDTPMSELNPMSEQLQAAVAAGRRHLSALTVGFSERADAMGKELARELADAAESFSQYRESLRLWQGRTAVAIESRLRLLEGQIRDQHYSDAKPVIAQLNMELTAKARAAGQEEEKHQKRLYVFESLIAVCKKQGFDIVGRPRYSGPGGGDLPWDAVTGKVDRRADIECRLAGATGSIEFKVDTYDQGMIDFSLNLDQITSKTVIIDGKCFEELGRVSAALDAQYGITTKFRTEDGRDQPLDIEKGSRKLPTDDGKKNQQAGGNPR